MSVGTAYAVTPPPTPSKVNSLKATPGDGQVTLSWTSPTSGKPVTNYTVRASPGGYDTTDTSEPRTVPGLSNGTLYTFTVFAWNANGPGVRTTITATPRASPPTAPTNLGATQIGPGSIRLDWTPPTSNGSTPPGGSTPNIDHYNVSISPGGTSTQVPQSTLTYTANGLADNVTYTFSVSATSNRPLTGPAAVVYAPLPTDASIGLQPTAGVITISITVSGQNFLKNESLTLYWDLTTHPAATLVTDDNGAFTKVLKPRAADKPGVHKLCANVRPKPCANFTLQATPKPTPASPTPVESPSPSPSPSGNPQASGARTGGGGISGLDILTRPPFVFLPIIGILGLLGVLIYWFLSSRRRPMAPGSASVVHHATRPDYMEPFPSTPRPAVVPPLAAPLSNQAPTPASAPPVVPPVQPDPSAAWPLAAAPPAPAPPPDSPTWGTAPPAAPPPPVPRPSAWPPEKPPVPVEAPPPPVWPAAPDEPPDLPQPSD
jgi:Fibronectin type III domain